MNGEDGNLFFLVENVGSVNENSYKMFRWVYTSASRLVNQSKKAVSSLPTPAVSNEKPKEDIDERLNSSQALQPKNENANYLKKSPLVASAFASLKSKSVDKKSTSAAVDHQIVEANSAEELLCIADNAPITRRQAFKIVTILAEWSVSGKENIEKYESNPKFISLCQLIGGNPIKTVKEPGRASDLSVVLNVAGDDEAARLVSTISLQQMIKVLTSLAAKKRRSTPLLRSLAFNIRSSTAKVDVKQGADILYALATLNFPDEALLTKICTDLLECISTCQKSAVIGSIATSLGLLRYKNLDLLHVLCEWVTQNKDICRVQDLSALLQTLATVNHLPVVPGNFFEAVLPLLKIEEFSTSVSWLDVVWSLVILGQGREYISSILSPEFIGKLSSQNGLSISCKKKILNINGVARWTKGYKGPLISESSDVRTLPMVRSKEKQALVSSVLECLSNLIPSATCLRTNIDSGMGFVLDGECLLDGKMTPLPVIDRKTGEPIANGKTQKGTRIAIMVWDYHDFTRGKHGLNGAPSLTIQLLSQAGFKVLSVPYTEYNQLEKLTVRVQYLEKKLKGLVGPG